ncbi:MAG: DUF4105 domain-containing protein [Bacteroides sp.]
MRRIIGLLTLLMLTVGVRAEAKDSIRLSLLTCDAGEEIYTLFGHSAIRYQHRGKGIDVVFNYGLFNFGAPNFILRFALGETDYQLGMTTYDRFAAEYAWYGRDVVEQELNLNPEEKERLVAALEENYLPQNRVYRYNFFYDNCATRPRDQIERAVTGDIRYAQPMDSLLENVTYRTLLHRYSEGHPWSRFGMDLCMGSEADRPITRRAMMFVPFLLHDALAQAVVLDNDSTERPLVCNERRLVQTGLTAADHRSDDILTPDVCAWLLLVVVIGCTWYGFSKRRPLWGIDLILFLAAGTAGCILAFLALFSQHPAVSPNYLLWVFHPLHLFCLPCLLRRVAKGKISRYLVANIVVLTLFIILKGVIPQEIPPTVVPLAGCLLLRSAYQVILAKQKASK